ncbi:MAG: hypothetical protein PHC97_04105 [Patescibacteria group bacterium]|nr:hypothetical protein [Patescibacteria group bacterium]
MKNQKMHYFRQKCVYFLILALVLTISNLFVFLPKEARAVRADGLTCGSTITTDVTFTADLDCSGTGSQGLLIGADNITIDGNGYTIDGTYNTPATEFTDPNVQFGVANVNFSHVTIKNLHVKNFFYGIVELGSPSAISNITIENNIITNDAKYDLSFVFPIAISLYASDQNLISGNQIEGFSTGMNLTLATNSDISDNSIIAGSGSAIAADTDSTSTSSVANNFIKWYSQALALSGVDVGSSASVSGNTFLFNDSDTGGGTNINFANNLSLHNIENSMIFIQTPPDKNLQLGDTANFTFDLRDEAQALCPDCSYSLTTSPSEIITSDQVGSTVTGSFVPSKEGTYSLQIVANDTHGNTAKRNMLFYVDSAGASSLATAQTIFYFRPNVDPVHGQPKGRDERSFLLTPPTQVEQEQCSQWVLNSIDELPDYPFSVITEQNIDFWHRESRNSNAYIRSAAGAELSHAITKSTVYVFENVDFSGLVWNMDYPIYWYSVVFEFGKPFQGFTDPFIQSTPAQPSIDTITHTYVTTPAIKYFSNPDALLLAANPSAAGSPLATLTLDGSNILGNGSSHSVNVTLDNYKYPFSTAMTEINSDGTATLVVDNLTAEETFSSVDMSIVPDSGYVDVAIQDWNVGAGGNYYKRWTETSSLRNTHADHSIADMAPLTFYNILVDGKIYTTIFSDLAGTLTFDYNGGYSAHTFEVTGTNLGVVETDVRAVGDYRLNLSGRQPTDDVTVTITTDGKTAVSPATLTFTSGDWFVPQDVDVSTDICGPDSSTLTLTFSSADLVYDGLTFDINVDILPCRSGGDLTFTGLNSLAINGGALTTSSLEVILNIFSQTAATMRISNDPNFTNSDWEYISSTKNWTLTSGEGEKTVYAQFKNSAGIPSQVLTASILYQPSATLPVTPPVAPQPAYLILHGSEPAGSLPSGVQIGSLIKSEDVSAVYFVGQDNRRHAFPDETVFFSWFVDFSGVKTISAGTLAAIPLGSNVTMRPGTYLIKIQSDPKVYAVEPYGVIRWITTEQIAVDLYGSVWNGLVRDVAPAFFINYQVGLDISASVHPTGSLIQYTGSSDIYYIDNGLKRLIPALSVFNADLFQDKFVDKNISSAISYDSGQDMTAVPIETLMTLR